jgi:diguanylate cyclase (GGDEF)-like protein
MLLEQKDTHLVTEASDGRHAGSPVVAAFIAQQVKVVSAEPSVILGLALPRASVVKQADRLGQTMVQIVVGLSLAAIFLALILGRVITRSINAMSSAVAAFTGSNTLENLPLHRQDEIGVLARSFDRMQNQIRHQLAELEVRGNELQQLAYHDLLTGLPNRRLMMDRLEHTLANTERHQLHGALLLLDLDNFKTLNDSLGHAAGDQLLVEVAARLKASIRQGDTAARLGGDEFVLILEQLDERGIAATQAEIVATKLLRSLAQPYLIEVRERSGEVTRHSHYCTSSIGIAMFSDRSVSPEELLKRADSAMYQSKAAGRNTLCFFGRDRQMSAAG